MKFHRIAFLSFLGGVSLSFVPSLPAIPAFPGAEGGGAAARGGRGGAVHLVTTLDDYGAAETPIPGSLRSAVEASGARTVVFRTSGTIVLKRDLVIRAPFITIAGQSAPGDGICLKDHALVIMADEVVVRYLRVRPGDGAGREIDALSVSGCRNVIVDHCSFSWAVDETASLYGTAESPLSHATMQWCIISESLASPAHQKPNHAYGGIWGGHDSSFHHNLLAHHRSRTPRIGPSQERVDLRNNVIYNWGINSSYGGEGSTTNLVASYYKPGPNTSPRARTRIVNPTAHFDVTPPRKPRFYVAQNVVEGAPELNADNWNGGVSIAATLTNAEVRSAEPFPFAAVRTESATEAYVSVLARAGATLPKRDPVDARIVREVTAGTAPHGTNGILRSAQDAGGWPVLKSLPAPPDADRDGLPDTWERAHRLNPAGASDQSLDADHDGYTNLEEFLNETDPHRAEGTSNGAGRS